MSTRTNRMHPVSWIPSETRALLDVGCNVGELLSHCRYLNPAVRLVGIEVNRAALSVAQRQAPDAALLEATADALPFGDGAFDCVTVIEVLEHVPADLRRRVVEECQRVLAPGGYLILRVPHAGMFAWLDPHNFRFRFPRTYRALVGGGGRDAGYAAGSSDIVWHHHFTRDELTSLLASRWHITAIRTGGWLLMPLMNIVSWPFYRFRKTTSRMLRWIERLAAFDIARDYGRFSYDILVVARKA